MSKNSRQIEVKATSCINDFFADIDGLVPYIADNDKLPVWDGEIQITNRGTTIKRVHAQVKGKAVKKLPKKANIPYNICKSEELPA